MKVVFEMAQDIYQKIWATFVRKFGTNKLKKITHSGHTAHGLLIVSLLP